MFSNRKISCSHILLLIFVCRTTRSARKQLLIVIQSLNDFNKHVSDSRCHPYFNLNTRETDTFVLLSAITASTIVIYTVLQDKVRVEIKSKMVDFCQKFRCNLMKKIGKFCPRIRNIHPKFVTDIDPDHFNFPIPDLISSLTFFRSTFKVEFHFSNS